MRDVDDADAVASESADLLEQIADVILRDGGGRLVHDDDAGVLGDGLGDLDLLLLSDREVSHQGAGRNTQVQRLEELDGPCLHGATVCEDASGAELAAQEDVLVDGSVQNRVELLVDHGNAVSDCLSGGGDGDGFTGDLDRSPVRGVDAHEDLHEGGLPGAVLAHEGVDLARVQVEGDVVQDPHAGEGLVDTDHLKAGGVHDQAFCGCAAATRRSLRGGNGGLSGLETLTRYNET